MHYRVGSFYQRHGDDDWTQELLVLAVVESMLVFHQPLHYSGEYNFSFDLFFYRCRNSIFDTYFYFQHSVHGALF